ncbi:nucleoside hydrolase [Lactobacillus helveticus]|uniref:Non-specific ribonucleoside hydrolase RihC n=1 Tax=Lactobacillus helveticus TaxID=1587 RepID=A0A9Q5C6E8_LACHE|nr:nucleoside hydrolase [Lactobacillus helveticus]NRO23084.1 Non-specific ribonucleoside hydrolase RihC [Lactobacillus helveticus]NRO35494.1 Non-specific ribonucleoside hydrolase RihC [Lactobacillus helveticus]NRO45543.1 Non-specific ribonucleoside hydrolase RihC [Lactobacillus helveticus]NRO63008.1 Non-specific ribonucleoside hydrolase RihC [Lactobacillus helveticus]
MNKKPLIISTDPGIDDIAAMTISFFAKELDVRMIVPTWGNVQLEYTLQNTLNLEKFLHTKVPVVVGANQPLVTPMISAASVHGKIGIAGFDFEEADRSLVKPGLAATVMAEEIKNSPEKVTLLGIGPLTDYALLFKQYPEVKENIDQIVIMGGNIGRGNHSPLAEYNIAGDPEAAQVVFHSGLPIKVAPLEIGNKAHLTQDQMSKVKECGEVGNMLYSLFSHIHEPDGDPRIKIYDPTAVGILLHPEMFTLKKANVEIELRGQFTYGASVINFMDQEHANAEIATDVDLDQFSKWFIDSIKNSDQGRE